MTRLLQPLSLFAISSKFASALGINEKKVAVELGPSDPVKLTLKTIFVSPLGGRAIAELQKLAESLKFEVTVIPDHDNGNHTLAVAMSGNVQLALSQTEEET